MVSGRRCLIRDLDPLLREHLVEEVRLEAEVLPVEEEEARREMLFKHFNFYK
jgi:hypothetical protein